MFKVRGCVTETPLIMELPNLTETEKSGGEKIKLPVGQCTYRVYLRERMLQVCVKCVCVCVCFRHALHPICFCQMTDMNETPTPTGLSVCDKLACS